MKKVKIVSFVGLLLLLPIVLLSQAYRAEINFPDIPGYQTLLCDFHMHTVFSDGLVYPQVRVDEAWREGLDAIAITDHIEYRPHRDDVNCENLNRSYELAAAAAELNSEILVIRGSEITRKMPPGHFNAIFLNDCNALETDDWRDSFKAAKQQQAFIFWNHPGWKGQQPDGIAKWYSEHTELLDQGCMHGIEVANYYSYYPEVHKWALDKNLTMLANSDIHNETIAAYNADTQKHRPLTLVFATEKTIAGIREALFAGRTAVYFDENIIGRDVYLRPLFKSAIEVLTTEVPANARRVWLKIQNNSDVSFTLVPTESADGIQLPERVVLQPRRTVRFLVQLDLERFSDAEDVSIPFFVDNLKILPNQGMPLEINVKFIRD